MKKCSLLLALIFLCFLSLSAQNNEQRKQFAVYAVAFYNLENLFDTIDQPDVLDEEFTPHGGMRWTSLKYNNKLKNMSYAISQLATDGPFPLPNGPAIIGISEIENRGVVEDLIKTGKLAERNYGIVHYDSPDRRGVDVGLIYDKDQFTLENSDSFRLVYPADTSLRTRDQLLVNGILGGERVHIIVNHWPSRLGSKLRNKGIDITKLPDTEEAIRILKDISRIDGIDKDKCRNNTQLRDKIARIAAVVWFIALKRDDMVLIQMFQNNIAELGLKSIFFNEDVMKEPELMSLLKSSEKALRFVEILNLRNAEELEEYKKRDRGR